jgi:hypothetical protein
VEGGEEASSPVARGGAARSALRKKEGRPENNGIAEEAFRDGDEEDEEEEEEEEEEEGEKALVLSFLLLDGTPKRGLEALIDVGNVP